ncbi:MAG: hypothetical protein RSC05_04370, partial [Acinetobacter sp.]
IMVYQAYNPTTKVLTVKRGALDTVPQKHLSGNTFFFYDAYPSFDTTQYVDGETVNAKSLTTTPSSVLNIADASELPLEFNARAIRPYPPANVKINGSYYPVEIDSDLILTWVDRNRLQQTGGDILGWLDGGVAIENGAEYIIEVVDANNNIVSTTNVGSVNSYDVDYSVVETEYIKVRIYSVRDAYQSYQIFEHTMQNLNFLNKPKNLTAEFTGNYSPENLTAEFYNE